MDDSEGSNASSSNSFIRPRYALSTCFLSYFAGSWVYGGYGLRHTLQKSSNVSKILHQISFVAFRCRSPRQCPLASGWWTAKLHATLLAWPRRSTTRPLPFHTWRSSQYSREGRSRWKDSSGTSQLLSLLRDYAILIAFVGCSVWPTTRKIRLWRSRSISSSSPSREMSRFVFSQLELWFSFRYLSVMWPTWRGANQKFDLAYPVLSSLFCSFSRNSGTSRQCGLHGRGGQTRPIRSYRRGAPMRMGMYDL